MTEVEVQNLVWREYATSSNLVVIPCSNVLGWEADMLVVTRALLAHEFEIKLTRADFRADMGKEKWAHFQAFRAGSMVLQVDRYGFSARVLRPANYFWYVCPPDLLVTADVPTFAGLAYATRDGLRTMKKPERLHREKLSQSQVMQITRAMSFRYWQRRNRRADGDCHTQTTGDTQ